VAKKKTTARPSGTPEEAEPAADPSPAEQKAADAVRLAEAELEKARGLYEKVRQEATERLKSAREKTVGDLIDGTLATVKKHPGPGVLVAVLIGFFLGRWFRR